MVQWILRLLSLILTTVGDLGMRGLLRFILDRKEFEGVVVWGASEDIAALLPALEQVKRHRQSALKRFASLGVGLVCATESAVDVRRRRVCVNIESGGSTGLDIVALSRAMQLFPAAAGDAECPKRIADLIERDVRLFVLRLRSRSDSIVLGDLVKAPMVKNCRGYVDGLWARSIVCKRSGSPRSAGAQ